MELLTCQIKRLSTGSNEDMDIQIIKSDTGDDDDSVTLGSDSELYNTGSKKITN
jgi:hypothetical protein